MYSVSCNLPLALFLTVLLGMKVGLAVQAKDRSTFNNEEDGQESALLIITNATGKPSNNLSLIQDVEANESDSSQFSTLNKMTKEEESKRMRCCNDELKEWLLPHVEDIKRIKSSLAEETECKDEQMKNLKSSIDEMKSLLSFHVEDIKRMKSSDAEDIKGIKSFVSGEMASKDGEMKKVQASIDELKILLSSHVEESKKRWSYIDQVHSMESIGYQLLPGFGYYKYHKRKATFAAAVKTCKNEGGHLVIPNSKAEVSALWRLWREKSVRYAPWVGIHDPEKNGQFQTILGTPLNETGYTKWKEGPDKGDCVFLNSDGLQDLDCTGEGEFICEHYLLKDAVKAP